MIKKILGILLFLTSTIILIACGNKNFTARALVDKLQRETNKISFKLKVEDNDNLIGDDIEINIKLKEVSTTGILDKTTTKANLKKNEDGELITFSNLRINFKYNLVITTSWNNKEENLYSQEVSTVNVEEYVINQDNINDFFNMNETDYKYSKFVLGSDLDFTGIEAKVIKDFKGTFDGKKFALKNFKIEADDEYLGVFGQLSGSVQIKDVTLDKVTIKTKTRYDSQSKYVGILYGQNSGSSVIFENITIKDSKIEINEYHSTSDYFNVGLLGGNLNGKALDIEIINSNININAIGLIGNISNSGTEKGALIGGVVGEITKSASIKNVQNSGKITFEVNQSKEKGLIGNNSRVKIGGFAGYYTSDSGEINIENVITKTNIETKKLNFSVAKVKEDVKHNRNVELVIGGLFGHFSGLMKNLVYSGNIEIKEKINYEKLIDDEMKYEYNKQIRAGAIAGISKSTNGAFENVLRVNGKIDFITQDVGVVTEIKPLFGSASGVSYNENNKFGYTGTIDDDTNKPINDERKFEGFNDLFKDEESWIRKNWN